MSQVPLHSSYNRARLDDRQITELIGMSRGMLADGNLNNGEITYLYKWLAACEGITQNPLVKRLFDRIDEALKDGVVTDEERHDLVSTLSRLTGSDFEVGEALKATTLPVCDPAPVLTFSGRLYVFTGTFAFGSRNDCHAAVEALGALTGSLTKKTSVLVIGEYATDSWRQSSFGAKIEKAMEMRDSGVPISIVAEQHWRRHLP